MKSVNKVILVGHLGKDPEVKYTPQGTPVAKFSLATNERYKDKDGNWQDRTEWHNLVAWQRTAEIAGEYLKKGSQVYIEGSLRTRKYQDKETGKDRYSTEIRADTMQMLGRREGGGDPREMPGASSKGERGEARGEAKGGAAKKPAGKFDDMGDDIPF